MNIQRIAVLVMMVGTILTSMVLVTMAQEPVVQHDHDQGTGEEGLVAQTNISELLPCGAFETLRHQQTQPTFDTVASAPTSTPDPNVPTPTPAPTNTPRPAPSEDRVGFPENYATDLKLFFVFDRPDRKLVRAICGNDIAAQRQEGEPYPYGSVMLMISWAAIQDAAGQPVLDENGHFIRGRLVALHVMRKEEGFGEAYGEDRTGEWEYIAFNEDGSYQNTAETTNFCAVCHKNDGGEDIDYVFRMNLYHDGEAAFLAPEVGENEVSIYLYGFHQPSLEIKAGTTVTWVNNDQASHTVLAAVRNDQGRIVPAEEPLFKSDTLPSVTIAPGSSFSYTFEEPGEYLYLCTVHANMTGTVIVTE